MYCGGEGLWSPTAACTAGYYCPGGDSVAAPENQICPKGFHCPLGSHTPLICTRGKERRMEFLSLFS